MEEQSSKPSSVDDAASSAAPLTPGELVDRVNRVLDAMLPAPPIPTAADYAALLARYNAAQRDWEAALPVDQVEAAERMHAAWRALSRARNARLGGEL